MPSSDKHREKLNFFLISAAAHIGGFTVPFDISFQILVKYLQYCEIVLRMSYEKKLPSIPKADG